jgi:Zn-dependent protease with chaperone function
MMGPLLALAIGRPNALDREVNAIPVHDLLTNSPLSLIDPARATAAAHLEQIRIPVWTVMIAVQIGVLAWFWSAGYSARLRDALRSFIGSEFVVRFCFGALVALLDKAVAFIPELVQYRFSRIMDLSNLLFRSWVAEWVVATAVAMIVAGAIASIVLWLADRTHQWYVYTIAGVIGFTLLISYVNPTAIAPAYSHFQTYTPSGALAAGASGLERRTGIKVPILEEHVASGTRLGSAFVEGWGGSQRIVLSDTLLAGSTEPEVNYYLARAYAWISANSSLHMALIQGAFIVLGTALAVFISDRIGFRRDDDPVSRLALLGAIMGGVYLIALPFYNGYSKNLDLTTDAAAIALTHDPAAAVRAEVRDADQALRPVCPNTFAYWYLAAHPSPGQRIARLQGRADVCATQHP